MLKRVKRFESFIKKMAADNKRILELYFAISAYTVQSVFVFQTKELSKHVVLAYFSKYVEALLQLS